MPDSANIQTNTGLRDLAEKRGLRIGAAVSEFPLLDDPAYRDILAREFNIVTCENAMKINRLRPKRDRFAFEEADAIVAFAHDHGMAVRGHTLVWHGALPKWISEGRFERDEFLEILREHILTVTKYYRGKVVAWDVVNEAIERNGSWRDTIFLRALGQEYLALAFQWAHEGDPGAKLFYNDFDADGLTRKAKGICRVLRELLQQGVPIHGVGLQMHLELGHTPNPWSVAANIRRFNDLGLDVHITEMDVRMKDPATPERLVEQARVYGEILETCLAAEKCTALLTWGVTDRYSWIPAFFPGEGAGLLLDTDGQPKPAYNAIRETLIQFPGKSRRDEGWGWLRRFFRGV